MSGITTTKPRVVIADDHPAFLQKLVSLVEDEFEVVATASNGEAALCLVLRHKPHLLILDQQMPGLDGMHVLNRMASSLLSTPVILCSIDVDREMAEAALQAGALAYVAKLRVQEDLLRAARSVLLGKRFVSPE